YCEVTEEAFTRSTVFRVYTPSGACLKDTSCGVVQVIKGGQIVAQKAVFAGVEAVEFNLEEILSSSRFSMSDADELKVMLSMDLRVNKEVYRPVALGMVRLFVIPKGPFQHLVCDDPKTA